MGTDNYNLYVRRSFDGGNTWTTLPTDFSMDIPDGVEIEADGTITCEFYGLPGEDWPACYEYGAGDFEQARDLSLFTGSHDTVLDPRYAPTPGTITLMMVDGVLTDMESVLYPDDVTDPSKFFASFEAGDTAPIAEGGEGEPMDMYYARAVNYGDDYDLVDVDGDGDGDGIIENEDSFDYFDALEWHNDVHAAEAALTSNPGGTLFYAIYNAWTEPEEDEDDDSSDDEVEAWSDAIVRRTMELGDDGMTLSSQGRTQTGGGGNPDAPGGGGGNPDAPGGGGRPDNPPGQGGRND
jgi:hypothetical protein